MCDNAQIVLIIGYILAVSTICIVGIYVNLHTVTVYESWDTKQCMYIIVDDKRYPCDHLRKGERFVIEWIK